MIRDPSQGKPGATRCKTAFAAFLQRGSVVPDRMIFFRAKRAGHPPVFPFSITHIIAHISFYEKYQSRFFRSEMDTNARKYIQNQLFYQKSSSDPERIGNAVHTVPEERSIP